MRHSRSRERSPLIIEQGSSEAPSVSLSCQQGEAGQMERSLHFVCPAVRCGLTAIRYPLSAVRGNGIPERGHRLQTIRLQTLDSIDFTYHSGVPPLVAGATTFPPQAGALWMLSHGAMSLQESIERFILPPEQGEVRRSRKGGGERSEPVRRMVILPYDTEN